MPIYVDIITRLEERSATESAKQIEKQFGEAGKSAGTEFNRQATAEINRASIATEKLGSQLTQGFAAHGVAAGRQFGGGFGSELSRSIPGVSGLTSMLSGYEGAAGKAGALAGRALGVAFTAAAGGLIGVAGYALFKGFERYKSIDAATHRLNNLNKVLESTGKATVDVSAAMDTVNKVVEGTPFSLADAFQLSTQALSSPTGDLKRFMTAVTDAAGFAGDSIDGIGQAFLKVANTGKVSMEELQGQFSKIPIQQWLADTLGKGGDEIAKMISKGQIGLEDLLKTVEEHASGFAKAAGDTIEGTIGNLQTAFARLGANFLGAVFGKPTDDVNDLKTALDRFTERINDLGVWVNAHRDDIKNFFESAMSVVSSLGKLIDDVGNSLLGWKTTIELIAGAFIAWKARGVLSTVAELGVSLGSANTQLGSMPGLAGAATKALGALTLAWGAYEIGKQNPALHPDNPLNQQGEPKTDRMRQMDDAANAILDQIAGAKPKTPEAPAHNFYKDWYPAQHPGPADPTAPAGMPIQAPPGDSADGKTKGGNGPKLPDAPVIPYDPSVLPPGIPGMPRTAAIASVENSYIDAHQKLAEKRARLQQLENSNEASADDILKARNDAAKAERDQQQAEMRLSEARQNQYEQMTKAGTKQSKALSGLASQLGDIGGQLDSDFGISKGLAGIAENLTKFLAGLAFAPMMGQLSAISQANPIQGGFGLAGMAGAQRMAAQGIYSNVSGYGMSAMGPAPLQPGGSNVNAMMALAQLSSGNTKYAPASDLVNGLADCSGAISDLYEVLTTGSSSPARSFDTTSFASDESAAKLGFLPGFMPGAFNVGVTPLPGQQGHMAATLPNGVNFEGGGNTGGGAQYGSSAVGAMDPQFTKQYYMPVGPSGATAYSPSIGPVTPGVPYSPPLAGAALADPGLTNPAPWPNPGSGTGFIGQSPAVIGGNSPAAGPGGPGFAGMTGMPMQAASMAASSLDLLAPGAGQAAQMGMQLANRAIGYTGQLAGIGVGGLLETFLPNQSPLADVGNSWLGRLASGFAGASPALPNMAGQQAPPMDGSQGSAQAGEPTINNNTLNYTANHETSPDRGAADAERHWTAMNTGPGRP